MKNFVCDFPECSKRYKKKCNLKRHKLAFHSETKKYQCDHCSKTLSSRQNLREHLFVHTNECPYVCNEPGCGKRFRHGSQYSSHKKIHKSIKLIVDREASKSLRFFNIDLLVQHEISSKNAGDFNYPVLLPSIKDMHDLKIPDIKKTNE